MGLRLVPAAMDREGLTPRGAGAGGCRERRAGRLSAAVPEPDRPGDGPAAAARNRRGGQPARADAGRGRPLRPPRRRAGPAAVGRVGAGSGGLRFRPVEELSRPACGPASCIADGCAPPSTPCGRPPSARRPSARWSPPNGSKAARRSRSGRRRRRAGATDALARAAGAASSRRRGTSPHVWLPMAELEAERVAGQALRAGVELTPPGAVRGRRR